MVLGPDHTRFVLGKDDFVPRAILKQNLKALMASRNGPTTQSALHRKSRVAQATIGRILSDKGENARIETVERLAKAYQLQAWQLLVAGMDPSNPPVLQSASDEERALYARLKIAAEDIAKYSK